jgi:hypothetical protein
MRKVLLTSIALYALPFHHAFAGEGLKIRTFSHLVSVNSQDVGDVDGHTMSLIRVQGIAAFADGSLGTSYFTVFTDYVKGSGPIPVSYVNITANDGSVLWLQAPGTGVTQGQNANVKGTLQVLGGTGKFAGAKGDGTWTGQRLQPLPSAGAELYNELTVNLKE